MDFLSNALDIVLGTEAAPQGNQARDYHNPGAGGETGSTLAWHRRRLVPPLGAGVPFVGSTSLGMAVATATSIGSAKEGVYSGDWSAGEGVYSGDWSRRDRGCQPTNHDVDVSVEGDHVLQQLVAEVHDHAVELLFSAAREAIVFRMSLLSSWRPALAVLVSFLRSAMPSRSTPCKVTLSVYVLIERAVILSISSHASSDRASGTSS